MSNGKKLKPCPFCGEKVELSNAVGEYWVQCYCQAMRNTEAKAIEAWNTRKADTAKSEKA